MHEAITCRVTVRLFAGEDKCFGPGVAMLLGYIRETGSIRRASQAMGMAYSKAWTILRRAEAAFGAPLLATATGGRSGGGAALTPLGESLLIRYDTLCARLEACARESFAELYPGEASPERNL